MTRRLLVAATLATVSCSDTASGPALITTIVESQDNIVSEDGVLALTSGTLSVRSVSLLGSGEPVPMVGPVVIELSASTQTLGLVSNMPAGEYTGLSIELGPTSRSAETLDVQIQSIDGERSARATSRLTMSGISAFVEGMRTIPEGAEIELRLFLRGMFFYLYPLSDAVDGLYVAGEAERGFLTMDLIGLFDVRVSKLPKGRDRASREDGCDGDDASRCKQRNAR